MKKTGRSIFLSFGVLAILLLSACEWFPAPELKLNSNADLKGIEITGGTLSPAFSASTTYYTISVNTAHASVLTLNASAAGKNAKIDEYPGTIDLTKNNRTSISITVTAESGDIKSYTFNIADVTPHRIYYNGNEATSGTPPSDSNEYIRGSNAVVTDAGTLEKSGYIFVGWNTQSNGQGTPYQSGTTIVFGSTDITLYANWDWNGDGDEDWDGVANYYTVSFNTNGGSEIPSLVDVFYGEIITKPTDPIKDAYIFKGWFKEEQLINIWNFEIDAVTSSLVLYAKWRIIERTSPSEVTDISQQFDWSHNITVSWNEPTEEDFSYIKIYENDIFSMDVQKGHNSFLISSYNILSITIKTADDLDNISNGITYNLTTKEPGVTRIIIKDKNGVSTSGVNILGFASNKTTKSGISDNKGAVFLNYPDNQEITVLIAHPSFEGLVNVINTSQNYLFSFINDSKGSILAPSGICYIPGLSGRLNPIKDSLNRLYLYADNIAINGGLQQPVYFDLTNPLSLEDANGVRKNIWIPFIDGNTSLINYSPK